jgi:glutaredoxin
VTISRLLLLLVLSTPVLAAAEIYKWTDEQGKIHYSDSPPPETKAQQVNVKINSISGPAVVSTIRGTSPAQAKDKVRIYTAVWCGYCKKAKAHLASKGVPYDELDVETSEQGRGEFIKLGGRGVPVILVGNQRMNGFDAAALDAMLGQARW